jgi:hypothetical protein
MWHERLRQIDAEGEEWVPPEVVEEVKEVVEVVQVEADPEELASLKYAKPNLSPQPSVTSAHVLPILNGVWD